MSDNPPQWSDSRKRRGGLGRGLGALIPGAEPTAERRPAERPAEVPVGRLTANPLQPRQAFDQEELDGLVESIRRHGVLQPLVVRPVGDGYQVVAGERRWRAAQILGMESVPAIVRPLSDQEALELALVENLQREDLNPVERARAYRRLIDEFGLTQEQVAERVGKSQPSVANALRLLSLPQQILASLESGRLSEGHAKALLGVEDSKARVRLWEKIERRGLSVREAEAIARASIPRGITGPRRDAELDLITQELSRAFGTKVTIEGGRSRGSLRFHYYSEEDLQRVLDKLENK